MADLGWCKKQGKGIRLIKPNENLAKEYLESAEETLTVLKDIANKSDMWLAATKYYFEYFAVYALLMKIGIKSEIHDCTIEVCKLLEKEDILQAGVYKKLKRDKKLRIDNQYYLKNREVKINHEKLSEFLLKIKKKINSLILKDIEKVRDKIKNI